MADNVAITAGSGTTIAADEVTDGTLGTAKVQYIKVMDGTLNGTNKAGVSASGLQVDVQSSVLPNGAAQDATLTNAQVTHGTQIGHVVYLANPADGTQITYNNPDDVNIKQINGTTVLTGTGAVGTGAQRVAVAVDSATVAGSASLPSGTNVIGHVIADTGSTTAVTQTTAANLNAQVVGAVASGVTAAGNPLLSGARAATTSPTAVADTQAVALMASKHGKLVTIDAIRELKSSQRTVITSSTAETTIVTAAASTFNDLFKLTLTNTSATATQVDIRDTTGGTIIDSYMVPAGDTRGFTLPAGSGFSQTTVNTNWTAQCGTSVASLIVTANFVKTT